MGWKMSERVFLYIKKKKENKKKKTNTKKVLKNCFCILATFYHVKCFDKCSFVVFVVHVVIVLVLQGISESTLRVCV